MKILIQIKRLLLKIPFRMSYWVEYVLLSAIYLSHYKKWLAGHKHIEVSNRWELFSMCNSFVIDYFEFGVASGTSFKWWVENNKDKYSRFFGYDTFEGLPEKWGVYNSGDMKSDIPAIDDKRVTFIKGMFQDTFDRLNLRPKIVHLDCDLYSSMTYVLNRIQWTDGDIIIFDDFNVMAHGFRAFYDWTTSTKIKYEVIAGTKHNSELAIKIKEI